MKTLEFYRAERLVTPPMIEAGDDGHPTEWRWRLVASNGRIIANGGEGYQRLGGAQKGARASTWYHLRPDVKTKTTRKWGGKRFDSTDAS